jgi:acyl-coenzyme A thioesterase PaaI-like protein
MTGGGTHEGIDRALCGRPVELSAGASRVELDTTVAMGVDDLGLVHGGFVFGLADHAAMLAVAEPTVVLAAAQVRFLAPVRVGEPLAAEARVEWREGRRRRVAVTVRRGEEPVMSGTFECTVPERHVLAPAAG